MNIRAGIKNGIKLRKFVNAAFKLKVCVHSQMDCRERLYAYEILSAHESSVSKYSLPALVIQCKNQM